MAVRFEAAGAAPVGHLARPAEITGQPYTVMAWFLFDDDDVPGDSTLWSLNNSDSSEYDSPETIGSHALRLYTSTGNTDSATNKWSDATWHCFALVRSGNTRTLYRLDAGVVQILVRSTSEALAIAAEELLGYEGEEYSRGRAVEHAKQWQAALTTAELAREAQQFAPVRTANLVSWAKLTTHTDLSDEIGGAFTAVGATPSTADGPNLVEEWEGPRVASSNTTAATSSSGGLSINLPSGVAAGDLLMAFAANDTNVGWSANAGWTQIDNGANGSAVQGACWARLATGSDALTITGEANDIAVVTARIPAALHGVTNVATDIVLGTAATGNNAAPNGPTCNPGTSGKWLWLTYYAAGDDDDAALWWPAEGAPVAQVKSATDTSSCQVGVAYRWLEASSYDPSAFTLSAAEEWRAQTIAIPAVPPPSPPDPPTGLSAAGVSQSEIEASWDTDEDDDSYDLRFRSTDTPPSLTTQSASVPWHLERVYQRTPGSTGEYEYRYTGAGVRVYTFDTGVRATHNQLSGRVVAGYNGTDAPSTDDEYGHGTQVAGCVAGSLYGVAKGATIVPVKLWRTGFNDPPTDDPDFFDAYLDALAWILSDAAASGVRCVVNHSGLDPTDITSGEEDQIIAAWEALVDAGIVVCIAGGNESGVLPPVASWAAQGVIRVAACNSSDAFASFSNHGALVDIIAPGQDVLAIHNASDSATGTYSGTSYSSPIVAGICAMLLEQNPTASPARIRELLIQQATAGALTGVPANTPNLLAYSLASSTGWTVRGDVAEPYTIDGLEPESEYEIGVRRTVDGQTSDWSSGVFAETTAAGEPIEADAVAGASASGALTTAIQAVAASVAAVTAAGSLSTGIRLDGAPAVAALANGALSIQIRMQGAALAGAVAAAGLTSAIQMAAAAQAGAQGAGTLTSPGAELVADAAAGALAQAGLTVHIRFAGASLVSAIAQGVMSTGIDMQGAAAIAVIASAAMDSGIRMAGDATASALAAGDLGGAAQFAADAIAAALAAGDMTTAIRLAGAALAVAGASAALTTAPAGLAADAQALVFAEGGLTTAIRLDGASALFVQAAGVMDVSIRMRSEAFAQAMAAGVLSAQIRLDAGALSSVLAAADLSGGEPVVPPAQRTVRVLAQERRIRVPRQERVVRVNTGAIAA